MISAVDSQQKFDYWRQSANENLKAADTLLNGGHWLYVLFMCQQAIEKLAKGLYILFIDDNIPRINNIRAIIKKFENKLSSPISIERYSFLNDLSSFYINARYDIYKQNLSNNLNKQNTEIMLSKTKEVFTWLLTLKP
ncbi:MAG: HEPN domain-containing protein [Deltaproteobacteria bacterium]|nr:HEPN domain-containing protein [Deltaproteobacteria bacterium]